MTEAMMPVTVEQIAYERARGGTLDEMRDNARSSPLYALGDMVLVWVNEGDLALSTRATPPSPAGLAGEQIARIIEPNAFGSDFGLPDATVSKLAALDKADRILTALTANGSQPDRVVDVLRAARRWMLGRGHAHADPDCYALCDSIDALLSTLDAKDQSHD